MSYEYIKYKNKDVPKYELSSVPTSLFDENGDMRLNKQKSELKNTLKMEVSNRHIITEAVVVDGNGVLWSLHWPLEGIVEYLAEVYFNYVMVHLTEHDVYLLFDRYYDCSIKGVTRAERTENVALKHMLLLKTRLPEREIALGSMHDKIQVIHLIAKYIISETVNTFDCGRLFVTSADKVLALVWNGIQTKEIDVRTTHEEADIIVVKQCYGAVSNGCSSVKVISDDMDVFVLLAFFYLQWICKVPIFMKSSHVSRTVVDIVATVNKWPQIIPMLPAIHALTVCDKTSQIFGTGKKTALNICASKSLTKLGDKVESMEEIIAEATDFFGSCYCKHNGLSMTEKR